MVIAGKTLPPEVCTVDHADALSSTDNVSSALAHLLQHCGLRTWYRCCGPGQESAPGSSPQRQGSPGQACGLDVARPCSEHEFNATSMYCTESRIRQMRMYLFYRPVESSSRTSLSFTTTHSRRLIPFRVGRTVHTAPMVLRLQEAVLVHLVLQPKSRDANHQQCTVQVLEPIHAPKPSYAPVEVTSCGTRDRR